MPQPSDRRLAAALFGLLFLTFLPFFSGGFHSVDEIALFAQVESLFKWRALHVDQFAWQLWAMGPQDANVTTGLGLHVYSKKAPLEAFLALPLYAVAWLVRGLDLVHTAVFLNVLLIPATAVLVFAVLRRLEVSQGRAVGVALVFGLLTPSAVYAKLFFAEPAAALFLAVALLALLGARPTPLRAGTAGLSLGLSAAAAFQAVATFPAFGAYVLWRLRPWRRHAAALGALALGWALPLLGLAWFNLARFGSPLDTGYEIDTGLEAFTAPVWQGVYGMLLSPLRGAVYYAPALLLLLPAWRPFWRRHCPEAALILGASVPYLLLVAQWFKWWAGASWGPRYLVVVMPLLVLPLARAPLRRWWALALLGLSALAQLLGLAVNFNPYEALMRSVYAPFPTPELLWNPLTSPLLAHARATVAGELDLPWRATVPHLALLSAILVAIALAVRTLLRPSARMTAAVLPLATLLAAAQLLLMGHQTRLEAPAGIAQAVDALERQLEPGGQVVAIAGHPASLMFNLYRSRVPWITLNPEDAGRHPLARRLLAERLSRAGRLWLVAPQIPPSDPSNTVEAWLVEHAFAAESQWWGETRLVPFAAQGGPWRTVDLSWAGGSRLSGVSLPTANQAAGTLLPVGLRWESLPPPGTKLFVHLVRELGQPPLAQRDRLPFEGFPPPQGELRDRLALAIPPDLEPGRYQILIGWYDASTGRRLDVASGTPLFPIQVSAPGDPLTASRLPPASGWSGNSAYASLSMSPHPGRRRHRSRRTCTPSGPPPC